MKQERIKKSKEINYIFKNGKIIKSEFYIIYYIKNNLNFSRIGIIIKRKFGCSVKRNYEKRIIREFFRYYKQIIKNYDLLVIVKEKESTFINKKNDFEKILLQIKKDD